MRACVVWLLVLTACGRLRFDELSDARGDVVGIDAVLGPFGPPARVSELDDAVGTDDPTLTADMLVIFYGWGPSSSGDIWTATRSSTAVPFGTPSPVTELNTAGEENTPTVSDDGLTIYFSSNRTGTFGLADIWMATRPTRQSAWSTPTQVVELSSNGADVGLHVTSDDLHAVLNRDLGGNPPDLYVSSRPSVGDAWTTPVLVTEVNTPATESDGWLSPDGLVLWLASDTAGTAGMRDLWIASRAGMTDPFDPATRMSDLSSTADDVDPWLSPDQRTLYFASDRDGVKGIYVAQR